MFCEAVVGLKVGIQRGVLREHGPTLLLYLCWLHVNIIMFFFAPMQEFLCGAYLYWKFSASILFTSLGIQAPSVDKPNIATVVEAYTTLETLAPYRATGPFGL